MAYYVNGQYIPEPVLCPEFSGCPQTKSRSEEIAEFIEEDLPQMCNESVSSESAVINISVSLYYGVDAAFTEQQISNSLLNSSQALGITRRRRLYVSDNYLARRNGKKWQISPLLMQDEWLLQSKVQEAFEVIVRAKGWNETIETPLLCECVTGELKTVAWIARVDDGKQWHTLGCLPQNGLILIDRTENEFPVQDDARISVSDCSFRPNLSKGEITSLTKI